MSIDGMAMSIADKHGISRAQARAIIDTITRQIADELAGGVEVRLPGFGTFSAQDRAASEGRNPRTGEKIQIAAKRVARFAPAKALRDALNATAPGEPRRMVGATR